MGYKFAVDFGTTNTVIAHWEEASGIPKIVSIPDITSDSEMEKPSLAPSLFYVKNGMDGTAALGQKVLEQNLHQQKDNRLFRNFKRGIVTSPSPEPRMIDGALWGDHDAGRVFLQHVIGAFPCLPTEIEQLVLTAPVASFESYLSWLNSVVSTIPTDKIRVVDESTAAALGYAVTKPGALVVVFDFGGGTLDLSLVQLPESREKTGGFLQRLLKGNAHQHTAKVIAKAGRIIGGSDIDQWLVLEVLKRAGLTTSEIGNNYNTLLTRCEIAKIALSTEQQTEISFEAGGKSYTILITRTELEALLEANGFFISLRQVVDKVMHAARQRGIFKEDIHHVLLVGGTSLMPSVQRTLGKYFGELAVHTHKPFTAVAEGALQVAAGYGLEDHLLHSYGLRHLNAQTGSQQYEEIIPMGSKYPTEKPVEIILSAAHEQQQEIEFIIGEINSDAVSMIEVQYENGQAVFVAQGNSTDQQIMPLNEAAALQMLAKLSPAGKAGENRLKAEFSIDERRLLRLKVTDLHSSKILLDNVAVVTLR